MSLTAELTELRASIVAVDGWIEFRVLLSILWAFDKLFSSLCNAVVYDEETIAPSTGTVTYWSKMLFERTRVQVALKASTRK